MCWSFVCFINNKDMSKFNCSNKGGIVINNYTIPYSWLQCQCLNSGISVSKLTTHLNQDESNNKSIILSNATEFYLCSCIYSLGRLSNWSNLSANLFFPTPWLPTRRRCSPSTKSCRRASRSTKCWNNTKCEHFHSTHFFGVKNEYDWCTYLWYIIE